MDRETVERVARTAHIKLTEDELERYRSDLAAGDSKIDNAKFKQEFGFKPTMINFNDVEELIGHKVGGVCPFAIKENVKVYLDVSLKRFSTIFPACGSSNSAIELNILELEKTSRYIKWVDVCKIV